MSSSRQPRTRFRPPPNVLWLVLLAAGGTFALTMGVRNTMGVYLSSLNTSTGLGIANISLAFAFGQLWWGLTQPFAGAVADRIGTGRVIFVGVVLIVIGTLLTPFMTSTLGLIFTIGVLAAGGAGMAGPSVLMAASTRLVPADKRGMATGIVNAGGSFGQFMMAPIAIGLTASLGWAASMQWLGVLALLALPAIWVLQGNANAIAAAEAAASGKKVLTAREALGQALATPSYCFLGIGFLVCGFHVAFLATHLPGVVEHCGMPPAVAGWSLAMIGLFNIVGSLAMGWAVGRWRMKSLLSLVYTVRGLAVLVFLLAPKTPAVMLIFAAVMGVTFLSTVPPTAGLVAKMFGPANMAMLFGVLMVAHQVGGFLGAYLGGTVFQATGSYDWVWYIDIALAVAAALIHLPIREARPVNRAASAAA
ncbi:MFS transporter [Xanthomonas hortorum]|uniref:MFS transporter n=1 Tax=Xanthomonas hortorum pv. hederae TaxID=453603 RepID=A0A9X3YYU8_9XANT|nr:MFS transporter [Xanthomonas hortorum]MCE4369654.1 MFS transporter [Xanthomonas hortorum pv. hederae]MDC8637152.1 MFS transporter [Xanthomonas hortorum pv. hederae]PPU86197.1 MFS transporter [Xanthomonas hortorum pv. hederae]PUF01260.1 MFS transporter [Xanthomonas hortorum pv. hederae]